MRKKAQKLLFVVNNKAGRKNTDWQQLISLFFRDRPEAIAFFLVDDRRGTTLSNRIIQVKPDIVVAVGGDGTLGYVVSELVSTGIPLGIVPAGSANGMARELKIPLKAEEALQIILGTEP